MTKFLRSSRLSLLALLFTLWCKQVHAQVDTYTLVATSGNFAPLNALATAVPVLLADDAVTPAIPLPFTFNFDGTPYQNVYVNSNGVLSFNSSFGAGYDNSPTATNSISLAAAGAGYRPFVAPYADDLDGRVPGAAARYTTTGTSPNRVFTFQWLNWGRYAPVTSTTSFLSFQVKLYETTNVVQFIYRQEAANSIALSAAIGLAGVGTGSGSFLSLSDASAASNDQLNYRNQYHFDHSSYWSDLYLHTGTRSRLPCAT